MRALAIAVIATSMAVSGSCKTDDAKPAPKPPSSPPAARTAPPPPVHAELVDTVLLREPTFAGATPLAKLKVVDERAHQSWCVPGTDALAIATNLATALEAAGWQQITTRGTTERAATSGDADGVTLAITVGGRDAGCTGLVATGVYTTQTIIVPPLEDGERIR